MMGRGSLVVVCALALSACGQDGDVLSSGGGGAGATSNGSSVGAVSTGDGGGAVASGASTASAATTSASTTSAATTGATTAGTTTAAASSTSSGITCTPVGPETCMTSADDDCDGTECSLAASVYSGTHFVASASTPAGSIYLIGGFSGTLVFGSSTLNADSDHSAFLAKFSPTGAELWAIPLPTPGVPGRFVLAAGSADGAIVGDSGGAGIDFGGGPIAGVANGSVVVAFDANGGYLWGEPFNPPTAAGTASIDAIGGSATGKVAVVGVADPGSTFDGQTVTDPLSPVPHVSYLFELDAIDGSLEWTRSFYPAEPQYIDNLSPGFDSAENVIISGDYAGTDVDFGGGPLPDSSTGANGFIARFDASGTFLDSHAVGVGTYLFENMVVGPGDEIYVAGTDEGGSFGPFPSPGFSSFIARVEPDATVEWVQYFVQSDSNNGIGVPEVAAGPSQVMFDVPYRKPLSLGFSLLVPVGLWDLAVGKLGADGTPQWGRGFGSPGSNLGQRFFQPPGRLFVAPDGGSTLFFDLDGTADLGSGPLAPVGGEGIVVAHFAP